MGQIRSVMHRALQRQNYQELRWSYRSSQVYSDCWCLLRHAFSRLCYRLRCQKLLSLAFDGAVLAVITCVAESARVDGCYFDLRLD